MSLINQMLKDLETRTGLDDDSTFEPAKIVEATHAEASRIENGTVIKEKKRLSTFLVISITFIIVYLAMYYWVTFQENQSPASDNQNAISLIVKQPMPTQQSPVVNTPDNSALIVAEITAAIQEKIRQNDGQVNDIEIQEMVAQAGKTNVPDVNQNAIKPDPIAQYDTLNQMHLAAENAQSSHPVEQQPAKISIKTAALVTKPLDNEIVVLPKPKAKIVVATDSHEKQITKSHTITKPINAHVVKKSRPKLAKVKIIKTVRPEHKSEQLYQKALSYVQHGRVSEALNILAQSLKVYPANHDARQTLAALLLDNKRIKDSKTVLKDGLTVSPEHVNFRMTVARLEVELGAQSQALETLISGLEYAQKNADYQLFTATLLQRNNRHKEAVKHFRTALENDQEMTNAFVGLGVSLQALDRLEDAQIAYNNAQNNRALNPDLKAFIDFRIKEVNNRISSR